MRGLALTLACGGLYCMLLLSTRCVSSSGAAQEWVSDLKEDLARYRQAYHHYLAAFNKSATRALDERRLRRYVSSVKHVEKFSAESHSYKLSLNFLADVYPEEIASSHVEDSPPPSAMRSSWHETFSTSHKQSSSNDAGMYSTHLNWASTQNPLQTQLLKDVHSQGLCGACWALAAASAVEASVKIEALAHGIAQADVNRDIPPLSAQELIDCDRPFNNGCQGGSISLALTYAATMGLVADHTYGYRGQNAHCAAPTRNITRYFIRNLVSVNSHRDRDISFARALLNGPVGIGLCGTDDDFLMYAGGVFDRTTCCQEINHAMLLVGYGYDAVHDVYYWLALNSWGRLWGEDGFMKILRRRGPRAMGGDSSPEPLPARPAQPPAEGICAMYLYPVQAGPGYVLRADGALAWTGESPMWETWTLWFDRTLAGMDDTTRLSLLAMAAGWGLIGAGLCTYALYLEVLLRCQQWSRGGHAGSHQYSPIPDAPVEVDAPQGGV